MKKAKAMLLADALESGEYRKTKHQLREGNTNKCCCLGIACNLYAQANPNKVAKETNPERIFGKSQVLPDIIAEWFGFQTNTGHLTYGGFNTSLALLNDGKYSHKQIAQIIRDNYKQL